MPKHTPPVSSISDILANKQPLRADVPVVLDADIRERLDQASDRHAAADRLSQMDRTNSAAAAELVAANTALEDARAAAKPVTVIFRCQALGRDPFEQLRSAHPPTKTQRDEYTKAALSKGIPAHIAGDLAHNPDTFPPALIAASYYEPAMTVEEATLLWDSDRFSEAELGDLFGTALAINQRSRRADLGNG